MERIVIQHIKFIAAGISLGIGLVIGASIGKRILKIAAAYTNRLPNQEKR